LAVDEVAHQVSHDEHGQDDPDRGLGVEDLGHDDDVERRGAGESGFRESDAHRAEEREQ
jgi:hypothetical protein